MRLTLRILLPFLVLAPFVWGAWYFIVNKPKPAKFSPPPQVTQVIAETVVPTDYQIFLKTRGTVVPRTTTTLFPQVSGRVVHISPNFREGGFFEKGETLLSIEKVDYETALVAAESQLAQARTALAEEEARSGQAKENWRRLGKRGEPSDLVLRKPQLAEAKARLLSAEADVEKARRDLERTDVRAPYAGRILSQIADVGQYISPGTQLGRAFATDVLEVRLPLTNHQLGFVDLPETYRDSSAPAFDGPKVAVTAKIGRSESTWQGKVVRVDSAIDESSRQLFVVAQIEDPYRERSGEGPPLKIGMYVDALVEGQNLRNVFVMPRSAVRVSGEVILIDSEYQIERRKVSPIWKGEKEIVVPQEGGGIAAGEVLCLTPLAYPANGVRVLPTIDGKPPNAEKIPELNWQKGGKGKGKGSGKRSKGKSSGDRETDQKKGKTEEERGAKSARPGTKNFSGKAKGGDAGS